LSLTGSFHGNGTFALGTDLSRPMLEGAYAYADNVLALTYKCATRDTAAVTWAADGHSFGFRDKGGDTLLFRRKAGKAPFKGVRQEQGVEQGGRRGRAIRVHLQVDHAPGLPCDVVAVFWDGRGEPLKGRSPGYRTSGGELVSRTRIDPRHPFAE